MSLALIIALILAVFIGISLGLIGGGGSILTVPVMVYIMHFDTHTATSYSLFIVGIASLVGAAQYAYRRQIDFKSWLYFGIPSLISIYITRSKLMPLLPKTLTIGRFHFNSDVLILVLFSLLMIAASISMIRKNRQKPQTGSPKIWALALQGIVIGVLSGIIGVGGGFLIIPALIFFSGLDVKRAVGTSLLLICTNSLIGFLGDIGAVEIQWPFLLSYTALAVLGIVIGLRVSKFVSNEKLKPIFGWFILAMGLFILCKELFLNP